MLVLLHALLLVLAAGDAGSPAPETSALPRVARLQRAPRPVAELRQRLQALPAAERERLEHHLAEFEELPTPARRKLLERARALRERERSLGSERLQPGTGPVRGAAAPTGIEPDPVGIATRAQDKARLRDEFRAQGREVRRRLPDGLQKRLERAEPEQRRRLLERLVQERERFSRKAIETMGERLSLSSREVRRLERLPLDQRLHAMRELSGAARTARSGARGKTGS